MKYTDFIEKAKFNREIIIPALQNVCLEKRANKIDACGLYKYFALCDDCYTLHFNGAMTCKDKFCAVCQKKRSLLWLSKMKPIFDHYVANGQKVVFVTFTIKNTEKLKTGVDMINNAFRYMTNLWKQSKKEFFRRFCGGVRSMEVKRGAGDGLWHPHLHCLFVKTDNTRFAEDFVYLRDAWKHSLKVVTDCSDSDIDLGSVDYKAIKVNKIDDGIKAILETFKYITKFNWDNVDDIFELIETLQGMRMINTFGGVRKLLSAKDIEMEMDKSLTEIAMRKCSICGGNHFTEFASADVKCNHSTFVHDFAEEFINSDVGGVENVKVSIPETMNTRLQEQQRTAFIKSTKIFARKKFEKEHGLIRCEEDLEFLEKLFRPKPQIIQIRIKEGNYEN